MYLYETHCHTSEGSKCGYYSGADLVSLYGEKGYQGIIITDHFYNGNTAIYRDLPWERWVNEFCRGFENAKNQGKKHGIQVFFGWEYNFQGTEFLTYGLDKKWLLSHPELRTMEPLRYAMLVRDSGGILIHAHPFRQRNQNRMICLIPQYTDGVETINKCNLPRENFLADQYAENFSLMKVGGTDFHKEEHIALMGGMALPYTVGCSKELFAVVKAGQARIM